MKKIVLLLLTLLTLKGFAQSADNPMPYFTFGNGLGITPRDSIFSLNIRFRMQNRVGYTSLSDEDLSVKEFEMIVRRLRLRLDGFVYNPKFAYAIQFSFSRGDMDWDITQYPNIVRDAMFFYKPTGNFTIGVGQTKLPGNRQRIVSSGDLQFADRSAVNAIFTNDRDYGVQLYYNNHINDFQYILRGAITNGEGRNVAKSNFGLMYSSRIEIQPLGKFTKGGDYFEGDLAREKTPKLAIAGHYAFNDHTTRTGGTLGTQLYGNASYQNYGGDVLLKYKGWALSSELMTRQSDNPLTLSPDGKTKRFIYTGYGYVTDLSYLFKVNWMLGSRFSNTIPDEKTKVYEKQIKQYSMVVGKFIRGHRLKFQTDVTYNDIIGAGKTNFWQVRFQLEIGI
jgi:phosphate-selective porin OprO/OprP